MTARAVRPNEGQVARELKRDAPRPRGGWGEGRRVSTQGRNPRESRTTGLPLMLTADCAPHHGCQQGRRRRRGHRHVSGRPELNQIAEKFGVRPAAESALPAPLHGGRHDRDKLNPCDGTKLPKVTKSRVEPLDTEIVLALADAVPNRYRALVLLAAGSGMRQGECFGLTADRIDFLRRIVHVDRQLVTVSGRAPFLGPPKTPASVRTILLPTVVVDALAAHLAAYPPLEDGFVFVTDAGRPIRRTAFGDTWGRRQDRRGTGRDRVPRAAALLRQSADSAWRVGQGCTGTTRSCLGVRDARHLLPPMAGQRRPDPRGGRRCPFCGLRAD